MKIFLILISLIITGCSIADAKYQPKSLAESDLATVSGSGPTVIKLTPDKIDEKSTPYWVSIANVFDSDGIERVKPNAWSGHYEKVHLPEGNYLISGNCWLGSMYTRYKLKVNIYKGRQYQLLCIINDLEKEGFWNNNYSGKVSLKIEDVTDKAGRK